MGAAAARANAAVATVRSVLARDLRRRRVARADAAGLSAEGRLAGEVAVRSEGRELRAREIAFCPPAAHRGELVRQLTAAFAARGLRAFVAPVVPGQADRVVVAGGTRAAVRAALAAADAPGLFVESVVPGVPPRTGFLQRPSEAASEWSGERLTVLDVATGAHARARFTYAWDTAVWLEWWPAETDGAWVAPGVAGHVPRVPVTEQGEATLRVAAGEFPTVQAFARPDVAQVTFGVDVVYTWVDGEDPAWLARRDAALAAEQGAVAEHAEAAAAAARYVHHDELRFSLRSLETYAPWVNHVWIVTHGQVPAWLAADHPRVTVVDHREIWADPDALPSFNSHAIEANLHRIPGLSEHFLYLNDDMFFASAVTPEVFFEPGGNAHVFTSQFRIGLGEPVAGEPAPDSAGKNARRLVAQVSGRSVAQKLLHAPYALRRSLAAEIAERFATEVNQTARARFRRITDVTVAGSLHLYYALATGRAILSPLRYRYIDIGAPNASERLDQLLAERGILQTFCLNEASTPADPAAADATVRRFLARYFPNPCSFERSDSSGGLYH